MLPDRVLLRLLGLGPLLVVLGAFLPWSNVDGVQVFGVDGSGGRIAVALALGAWGARIAAARGARRLGGLLALGCGVGIALVALAALDAGERGPGVPVCISGAVLLVHGGLAARRRAVAVRP